MEGAAGVMIADKDHESAQAVAAACIASSSNPDFRAEAIHIDVTVEDSVKRAVTQMVKTFGRIDYCVNNAGVSGIPSCQLRLLVRQVWLTRFLVYPLDRGRTSRRDGSSQSC